MSRIVFFLGGESYPEDRPVELALQATLAGAQSEFVTQAELQAHAGAPHPPKSLAARLALLHQGIPAGKARGDVILVGRSAGARAVALFACENPVRAIICLAYPFRAPGLVLEPERFAHLARITTPTLIIQGANDPYGGLELTENYQLSAAITLRFTPGEHHIDPTHPPIRQLIRDFADVGWRAPPPLDPWFDEAFYLARYGDVARAVAAGDHLSGQHHYRRYGRAEGRVFRLKPEAAAALG